MLPNEPVCQVTITAPDKDWLINFGRTLVEDRLCASVHTLVEIQTIYRWQGDVHDATEAKATLHTRSSLVQDIVERVTQDHPYRVPHVLAVPIMDGNPDYLQWILDQTQRP